MKYKKGNVTGYLWNGQCLDGRSRHTHNSHKHYLTEEIFWDKEPCFIPSQLSSVKYSDYSEDCHETRLSKTPGGHLELSHRKTFLFISQTLAQMHSSFHLWQTEEE